MLDLMYKQEQLDLQMTISGVSPHDGFNLTKICEAALEHSGTPLFVTF